MANFLQITPYLSFRDVNAAVRFFVDVLGFQAHIHDECFAYVQREGAAVRIIKSSPGTPEERHEAGERAFLMYIDVLDVDAVVE